MSNVDPTLQGNGDQNGDANANSSTENPNIRQLREKAERADAAEAKLAKYEQAETIRDAGLDLNETQREALMAVHKGELKPEALLETAKSLGYQPKATEGSDTQTQTQQHQATVPTEVQQQHQAAQDAATGGGNTGGQMTNEDKYKSAKNAAELSQIIRAEGGVLAGDNE